MFYHNTSTVLLLHEDRVKQLEKMHQPLPSLERWKFWNKLQRIRGSGTTTLKRRKGIAYAEFVNHQSIPKGEDL
jgi:hypothetical protein